MLVSPTTPGVYIDEENAFPNKVAHTKALVFDWDGVFNGGHKGEGMHSSFSEPDSMGLNLVRFGYWLKTGQLPYAAIMTGANNPTARAFAKRESLHAVYSKHIHKSDAIEHFTEKFGVKANEIAFVYDDVLDLSAARLCGLRFAVKRDASPLFQQYIQKNKLADYITGCGGHEYAVREVCELLLGAMGLYDKVVDERSHFSDLYQNYLATRNAVSPEFFVRQDGKTVVE